MSHHEPQNAEQAADLAQHYAQLGLEPVDGLSPKLAADLVAAVALAPKLSVAAAYCGCSLRQVKKWLLDGSLAGAAPLLAQFSHDMMQAEAFAVCNTYTAAIALANKGAPTAMFMMGLVDHRLPSAASEDSISAILGTQVDKKEERASLLSNPPEALRAELERYGWTRPDTWSSE